MKPVKFGLIGCGNIAGPYLTSLEAHKALLEFRGATDLDAQRAREFTGKHGGRAYVSVDELLADEEIEVVLNLTIHHAHFEVIERALNVGKHIFSEKPLTMHYDEARKLVELAARNQCRLGCAPSAFLGEAQQTALRHLRSGALGNIRLVFAEMNHGRIESWHPRPQSFYDVGPLVDVGVYPLSIVTAAFGPARSVTGFQRVLLPERRTMDGAPFTVTHPDFAAAMIEFASGPVLRLTCDFFAGAPSTRQEGIEFHGDKASLWLASAVRFNTGVHVGEFGKSLEPVPLAGQPCDGVEWCRGLVDMAEAIRENRPHRAGGEQAAHIVEILNAIRHSAENNGVRVDLTSTFTAPEPMDWAR